MINKTSCYLVIYMQYSKHIHMTFFSFIVYTVLPGSIDLSIRRQTSTLPRAMTVVHHGEKNFLTWQNGGGDNRGKFAAGENTRHATKEKVWLAW